MRAIITIFVLACICMSQSLYAQNKVQKSKLYKSRSFNYLDEAKKLKDDDPAASIDHIQNAIRQAVESNDRLTEGRSYYLLGEINYNSLQYDIAITYLEKAKGIFAAISSEKDSYQTQKWLGRAYASNLQYEKALLEYNDFLNQAIKKGLTDDQIFAYQAISDIYTQQSRYDEALEELDKAEGLGQSVNSLDKVVDVKLQRGEVYEAQSNNIDALNEYKSSEDISRSVNNKQGIIHSNQLQSSLLKKTGRKNEAVKKQKENLELFKKGTISGADGNEYEDANANSATKFDVNDQGFYAEEKEIGYQKPDITSNSLLFDDEVRPEVNESRFNIEIAETYMELDSAQEAIVYLKDAIDISNESGALQEEKKAYGLLSEAYVKTGNYADALTTYQNYVALVDSLYQLKETDILASLNLNKELSKRLQRINSLEKDRTLQKQTIALLESQRTIEKERNSQLRFVIYALIIGLLLLLSLLYFARRNSRQKRITNQLLALKSLRTQMNPHFIFNALNSVNNFISQSDERSANRYLSDFSRLMRLVLENSEHDFIPLENELEIVKLYLSLEHLRFSEKFDYELEISSELNIEKYQIPPMIIQPYIENAVWHGLRYLDTKGKLVVTFIEENNKLLIRIEDDGIGRERSKAVKTKNQQSNRSTAMKNIKERLSIINGTHQTRVEVKVSDLFEDGRGTKVEISVEQ